MKSGVYRFKTFEEANRAYFERWLEKGKKLEDLDTYEYMRVKVKAYPPGVYRFKTPEEKHRDEALRVVKAWEKKNENR